MISQTADPRLGTPQCASVRESAIGDWRIRLALEHVGTEHQVGGDQRLELERRAAQPASLVVALIDELEEDQARPR
ncbi:MAG TPA: hypothetical protein VLM79_15270 [Kofleriaceae bacterium]|nr:hypothetical protein [Kofleriaceae bacterium]